MLSTQPPQPMDVTNPEYWGLLDLWEHGRGPHPTTGLWKGQDPASPPVKFIPCYWCLASFRSDANSCPKCGTAKDEKLSQAAIKRSLKSYEDIVRDNARKEGKDAKKEIQRAKGIGMWTFSTAEINRKLDAFLKRSPFPVVNTGMATSGWVAAVMREKSRICELCGKEYKPTIVSNRYGGQKFCGNCRQERNRQYQREHWATNHPKKDKAAPQQ